MIKEKKNIDFYTTGRQPSEEDFARISEWIKKNKEKQVTGKQIKSEPDNLPSEKNIEKRKATI